MDTFSVYVTRAIAPKAMDALRAFCQVRVNPEDRQLSREELLEAVKGCNGSLCMLSEKIDAAVMDAAGPQLKVIANYAVGFNNIDLEEATRRGIAVVNTPGVLTNATAEVAWALLFAAARRVPEGERLMRAGQFEGWAPMLLMGQQVTGATLGVVGAGRIGTAFALMSRGFNMKVLYTHPRVNEELERELGARRVELDELLAQSDFISLHVPLTDKTRHMIGPREFGLMKPNAVLVNTARGPVVDEKALVQALQARQIAAAGLDVFENEPAYEPELGELDQAVILPHVGSATGQTRLAMGMMLADNIRAVAEGRRPEVCVNQQIYGEGR